MIPAWTPSYGSTSTPEGGGVDFPFVIVAESHVVNVRIHRELGLLAEGACVVLLISLTAMSGVDVPRWVLCRVVVQGASVLNYFLAGTSVGES